MIETVASQTGEIVSLEEAKRELGVWDSADDARVRSRMEAARAYCEEWGEITLRLSATRTLECESWPAAGFVLRKPPVIGVTSVSYYDTNGTSQTLNASNYRVHTTAAGYAVVEWARDQSGFELPATASRQDAVTVTYTAGWQTAAAAPHDLKAAILLTLRHLDMEGQTKDLGYARNAAMRLLAGRAAPSYA